MKYSDYCDINNFAQKFYDYAPALLPTNNIADI